MIKKVKSERENKCANINKYKNSIKILSSENIAITLISLVITIILLIILAGIVINISIGENGLFKKAKYAKNEYLNAQSKEEEELNELYKQLGVTENLPENTKETQAGTTVKLPSKWEKYTPAYVTNEKGQEVISSKKVSSVYAVSAGNGETVPIPYVFYYVGGNLGSGVVISDNKEDKNKYAGESDVPNGVKVENGKFVDILKGNQFVFIPCTQSEYHKTNWANGKQGNVSGVSDCYWGIEISTLELAQIKKYEGFYVGRYEAGLPTSQDGFTGENAFESALSTTSSTLVGGSTQYNSTKIPISKAGREPWNFIDYNNSWASAQKMYTTHSVQSGLITGTQWDVMLNKIVSIDETKNLTDSKTWGNYALGETFNYTGKTAEYNKADNKLYGYGEIEENKTKMNNSNKLLTTGASEHNKAYNLYDVAGNLYEWTEESAVISSSLETLATNRIVRGGSFVNTSNSTPVIMRAGNLLGTSSNYFNGFRTVLYII